MIPLVYLTFKKKSKKKIIYIWVLSIFIAHFFYIYVGTVIMYSFAKRSVKKQIYKSYQIIHKFNFKFFKISKCWKFVFKFISREFEGMCTLCFPSGHHFLVVGIPHWCCTCVPDFVQSEWRYVFTSFNRLRKITEVSKNWGICLIKLNIFQTCCNVS